MSASSRGGSAEHLSHLKPADSCGVRLWHRRSYWAGLCQRAASLRGIAGHLVNNPRPGREMAFERATGNRVNFHDFAAVSGSDPQRRAVECDTARSRCFGLERADYLAFISNEVRHVTGSLVDNP